MSTLLILGANVGVVLLFWWLRTRSSIRHLGAVERGEVCLRCDRRATKRTGDEVRCEICGFATTLATLARGDVSSATIADMHRPTDNANSLAMTKPPDEP